MRIVLACLLGRPPFCPPPPPRSWRLSSFFQTLNSLRNLPSKLCFSEGFSRNTQNKSQKWWLGNERHTVVVQSFFVDGSGFLRAHRCQSSSTFAHRQIHHLCIGHSVSLRSSRRMSQWCCKCNWPAMVVMDQVQRHQPSLPTPNASTQWIQCCISGSLECF